MRTCYALALPALLLAGTHLACKKNNSGDSNGTYASTGAMSVGPVRMYVAGSVITDTAVTGPMARRSALPNADPYLGFLMGPVSGTMPFTYRVTINDRQGTIGFMTQQPLAVDILRTPERLLLAVRDSSTYFYPTPDDRCAQLLRRVTLDHSDSSCYNYPTTGNLSARACKYRDVFPLEVAGPALNLPTMVLAVRSGSNCIRTLYNAWGRFDPAVAALLRSGDTILVQERVVPLQEQ